MSAVPGSAEAEIAKVTTGRGFGPVGSDTINTEPNSGETPP